MSEPTPMLDPRTQLWLFLRRQSLGFRFRRRVSIAAEVVDFASSQPAVAICVDADGQADARLHDAGYDVLHFSSSQLQSDFEAATAQIVETLQGLHEPQAETPEQAEDAKWMRHALALAHRAAEAGEVPVGALIVRNGACIAEGWNRPLETHDPSAHAEMLALREAGQRLGNYRLDDCTLYVTLEPCVMCAGAVLHARVSRLVFGAWDAKAGGVRSAYDLIATPRLNHRVAWTGGVLERESGELLREFFRGRR